MTDATDALIDVMASLNAAISLLENTPSAKKAAPSDKMFAVMLADYKKSLARARAALLRALIEQEPAQ